VDVVRPELVEGDVAEVRDEVGGDVVGVATAGVVVDLDVVDPAGQVLGEGGDAAERAVGLQAEPDGVEVGQFAGGAAGGLDEVGDLGQPFRVFAGEVKQSADLVDLVLCGFAVLKAGAGPQLASFPVGGRREFELVCPLTVGEAPGSVGAA
jgi:hypothetical protein